MTHEVNKDMQVAPIADDEHEEIVNAVAGNEQEKTTTVEVVGDIQEEIIKTIDDEQGQIIAITEGEEQQQVVYVPECDVEEEILSGAGCDEQLGMKYAEENATLAAMEKSEQQYDKEVADDEVIILNVSCSFTILR